MKLPALSSKRVVALLKRAGFVEIRQKGSHLTMYNARTDRMTVVPIHGKDLKRGTLHRILFTDCGLTRQDIQELLK
jgi:predicted RNA binding protein YcfA (HicA-like mRNA interferase family)